MAVEVSLPAAALLDAMAVSQRQGLDGPLLLVSVVASEQTAVLMVAAGHGSTGKQPQLATPPLSLQILSANGTDLSWLYLSEPMQLSFASQHLDLAAYQVMRWDAASLQWSSQGITRGRRMTSGASGKITWLTNRCGAFAYVLAEVAEDAILALVCSNFASLQLFSWTGVSTLVGQERWWAKPAFLGLWTLLALFAARLVLARWLDMRDSRSRVVAKKLSGAFRSSLPSSQGESALRVSLVEDWPGNLDKYVLSFANLMPRRPVDAQRLILESCMEALCAQRANVCTETLKIFAGGSVEEAPRADSEGMRISRQAELSRVLSLSTLREGVLDDFLIASFGGESPLSSWHSIHLLSRCGSALSHPGRSMQPWKWQ